MRANLPKIELLAEFREFLLKQNALALTIGVVIGGAVAKVVSGIVEDIFMPILGVALPGGEWRSAELVLSPGGHPRRGHALPGLRPAGVAPKERRAFFPRIG